MDEFHYNEGLIRVRQRELENMDKERLHIAMVQAQLQDQMNIQNERTLELDDREDELNQKTLTMMNLSPDKSEKVFLKYDSEESKRKIVEMEKELEKQKGQVTHVENKLKELKKAKPNSHKLVTLEKEKKELEERSENQKRTIELHIKTIKRYDGEAKSRESDYTKLENNNIKIKKES